MAARPPTIGDLIDKLLLCIFAALPTDVHVRCILPCVCRRWRAAVAAPAAAALWARASILVSRDLGEQLDMLRWLSVHGQHVRELELAVHRLGRNRGWDTAMTAMAMAPGMMALDLDCSLAGSTEWWPHLGHGLTRLYIQGNCYASLARVPARGGLPASLLELELHDVLGAGPHADLPRALGALSRLTYLSIYDYDCAPAAGDAFWRPLRELMSLRSLRLDMPKLEELPAAVGALTALTS
jgi:hypothetical protein